jgi:putative nucleotidyltransferase with HDIG domain
MKYINQVREHVLDRYSQRDDFEGMTTYNVHVKHMVEYAKQLAKKLKANEEIVEIAALLHDIGRLDGTNENHHEVGAQYAEKYLKDIGYDKQKISVIKNCILAHRGSVKIKRESIEAECIASADAMAHFGDIPSMFYWVYVFLDRDIDEGKSMVLDKYKRSFKKMMPEAQDIVREKYESILKIIE